MPTTTILPRATYPAGTRAFGPVSIPVGITIVTVLFDLSFLTALTAELHWHFDLSVDGGQSWQDLGGAGLALPKSGFSLIGGVLRDPEGRLVTQPPGRRIVFPDPSNPNRQVRGTMRLTEPFETQLTVIT